MFLSRMMVLWLLWLLLLLLEAGGIVKTELCPESPWAVARPQPSRLVGEFPQSLVLQALAALQGCQVPRLALLLSS